jgi:ATP synthase F1 delta subunit
MRYTPKHYAEALRAAAADADTFRHLLTDLASVVEHLAADQKVREFFTSATVARDQQESVLRDVFQDFLSKQTYAFLRTLIRNHQISLLEEIIAQSERIAEGEEGSSRVSVESAIALDEATRVRLASFLEEKLKRRVLVTYDARPELIAGLRVTVDGTRHWDGTVAGKLQRLRQHIQQVM